MNEKLSLVKPAIELESAYLAMREECLAIDGETPTGYRMSPLDDGFPALVERLNDMEKGIGLPDWAVPQTTWWLMRDGADIIGEVRLRHRLTPALEQFGGHIGYMIRPSERRKGYGTKILAMVLEEARAMGLERVLLTCDPKNTASSRIMENNGGVKDTDSVDPKTGRPTSRYLIQL